MAEANWCPPSVSVELDNTASSPIAAAAGAGFGVTPIIDGLAPEGLGVCSDKRFPPLPEVTLILLARSQALAIASRRWVETVVEALQSE